MLYLLQETKTALSTFGPFNGPSKMEALKDMLKQQRKLFPNDQYWYFDSESGIKFKPIKQ